MITSDKKRNHIPTADQDPTTHIEELLTDFKTITVALFDQYIHYHLARKADKQVALQELDTQLGNLQNQILSLAVHVKQNYLIKSINPEPTEVYFYTQQELAVRYRVSVRTITNWIVDGLECTEIGGVKRISSDAVKEFVKKNKTKKFNWRSVCRKKTR